MRLETDKELEKIFGKIGKEMTNNHKKIVNFTDH